MTDEEKTKVELEGLESALIEKALQAPCGHQSMFSKVGDRGFFYAVAFLSIAIVVSISVICHTCTDLLTMILEYMKADLGGF